MSRLGWSFPRPSSDPCFARATSSHKWEKDAHPVVLSNHPMKQPWLRNSSPPTGAPIPALRMCSLAARGLWIEMLCLMHEARPHGSLLVNGKPVTAAQLANLVGGGVAEVEGFLAELEEAGVFSRDADGALYSRRMRRDEERAAVNRVNGRAGGNPSLKQGVNPAVNPPVNPADKAGDKAQKPESKIQTPEPENSAAPEASLRAERSNQGSRATPGLLRLRLAMTGFAGRSSTRSRQPAARRWARPRRSMS